MSLWVPARVPTEEMLDRDVPSEEAEASLGDIEWVHRRLGGRRLVARRLLPLLASLGDDLSLVDIGCGSGHVGRDIAGLSARRGRRVRVLGLDRKLAHLLLADGQTTVTGDAFRLPFRDRSIDVVFSTLFLHHVSPERLPRFLLEVRRVARRAVVFFDLARNRVALAAISVLGPLAFRSRLSIHDGPASVRQAYTRREIQRLAGPHLPGVDVRPAGPFVLQIVWRRR